MKQITMYRATGKTEVGGITEIATEVFNSLKEKKEEAFFNVADSYDVYHSMKRPSAVFVALNKKNEKIGFVMLKEPNEDEEQEYEDAFPEIDVYGNKQSIYYRKGEALIVKSFGVKPEYRRKGVVTLLLQMAKIYAGENYTQFITKIHPEDRVSEKIFVNLCNHIVIGDEIVYEHTHENDLKVRNLLLGTLC